jgi:hypothetical protein
MKDNKKISFLEQARVKDTSIKTTILGTWKSASCSQEMLQELGRNLQVLTFSLGNKF